jgi:hypothetical protein
MRGVRRQRETSIAHTRSAATSCSIRRAGRVRPRDDVRMFMEEFEASTVALPPALADEDERTSNERASKELGLGSGRKAGGHSGGRANDARILRPTQLVEIVHVKAENELIDVESSLRTGLRERRGVILRSGLPGETAREARSSRSRSRAARAARSSRVRGDVRDHRRNTEKLATFAPVLIEIELPKIG